MHKDGAANASYSYDSNSNRLSHTDAAGTVTSGTYDNQDRLTQYGGRTYTYTSNGELASKTEGTAITTYAYDALGNLTAATLPDGTPLTYVIDGQNRRVGKKVNGTLVQGFLYSDSLRIVAELDGTGAVVSRFVYGDGVNIPEYMVRGGVSYRIVTDHLGSPRLVINSATGAIAQRIDYDEFGNVTQDTNPGFQPFGFAGGSYDHNTKLTHFWHRDYEPFNGRWLNKDPMIFSGGYVNIYNYIGNDPLNSFDPFGLEGIQFSADPFALIPSGEKIDGLIEKYLCANGNDPCDANREVQNDRRTKKAWKDPELSAAEKYFSARCAVKKGETNWIVMIVLSIGWPMAKTPFIPLIEFLPLTSQPGINQAFYGIEGAIDGRKK